MKRRNFIFMTAAGACALVLPTWSCNNTVFNPLLAEPEMGSFIWDDETIAAIGKSFLQQFPDEDSKGKLTEILSKQLTTNPDKIVEILNQEIKDDFKNDRIVMLDGWIVSVTEARQCALFSLTQTN
jgi:hypothetical protein